MMKAVPVLPTGIVSPQRSGSRMTFLDVGCADVLSSHDAGWDDALRPCGLPLEVVGRTTLSSTHGPVDHLQVQCARGHRYTHVGAANGPSSTTRGLTRHDPAGQSVELSPGPRRRVSREPKHDDHDDERR